MSSTIMRPLFRSCSRSDLNRFALDIGTQPLAYRAVGHRIDGATQQVFDIELRTKVAFGGCAPVETNQDIDIAVIACLIAGEGAEQGEIGNADGLREGRLVRPKQGEDFISAHWPFLACRAPKDASTSDQQALVKGGGSVSVSDGGRSRCRAA